MPSTLLVYFAYDLLKQLQMKQCPARPYDPMAVIHRRLEEKGLKDIKVFIFLNGFSVFI